MTNRYSRFSERPYETTYVCFDTLVEADVQHVWSCAIDIESWMSEYTLETLDGQRGRVGYFQRVYPPVLATMPPPHYHYYGIAEIIPQKLIALETFNEKGGSYGRARDGMHLDLIVFADFGDRTKVTFVFTMIDLGAADPERPSHKPTDTDRARWNARMERYFENLKQLVRSKTAAVGE